MLLKIAACGSFSFCPTARRSLMRVVSNVFFRILFNSLHTLMLFLFSDLYSIKLEMVKRHEMVKKVTKMERVWARTKSTGAGTKLDRLLCCKNCFCVGSTFRERSVFVNTRYKGNSVYLNTRKPKSEYRTIYITGEKVQDPSLPKFLLSVYCG